MAQFAAHLVPGATTDDCRSALHVGPVACDAELSEYRNLTAEWQAGVAPAADAETERRVDAFLAHYGKPPREAVRALLEPSDRNIREYLLQQQESLAVVSYVAARMTALQAAPGASDAIRTGESGAKDLAAFMQMRLTLAMRPGDPQAGEPMRAMRLLALHAPALQARVQLVARLDAQALRLALRQIEAPLETSLVDPNDVDTALLPYVRIEDLRGRRTVTIDGHGLTQQQLRLAVLGMRETADALQTPPP